jgi:hypothetical protein
MNDRGYSIEYLAGRRWHQIVVRAADEAAALRWVCVTYAPRAVAWRVPGGDVIFNERYRRKA